MKHSLSFCPNDRETIGGFCWLAFQLLLLPSLLIEGNTQLSQPLTEAQLNFVYYLINFMAVLLIFPQFLSSSLGQVWHHPIQVCQAVILGFVAYWLSFEAIDLLIAKLAPGYANLNDEAVFALTGTNRFLMVIGTVVLVPPVEECLFRGLIFRRLYGRNRFAAYLVSALAFAGIHLTGYLGAYSPLELALAVLQYLPAGIWLAWSYAKSDTVFAPIAIHAAVNYFTINGLR